MQATGAQKTDSSVMESKWPLIAKIEKDTRRKVTIETRLSNSVLQRCSEQSQSPLYQLPKELRDMIMEFATAQYEDSTYKYNETAYYYRPGHTARLRIDTKLLLTCRRAWLEANPLPLRQAEHAFWFQRGPFDVHPDEQYARNIAAECKRYTSLLNSIPAERLHCLRNIHIFVQMFHLADLSRSTFLARLFPILKVAQGLTPKVFQMTVRHTDWWAWETDKPLSFPTSSVQYVLDSKLTAGVHEFKLELETLERKKAQLQPIVEELMKLQGKARTTVPGQASSEPLTQLVTQVPPVTWTWSGTPRINDKDYECYQGLKELRYYVAVITWRSVTVSTPDALCTEPEGLLISRENPARIPNPGIRTNRWATRIHDQTMLPRGSLPAEYTSILRCHDREQRGFNNRRAEMIERARRRLFDDMMTDEGAKEKLREWEALGSLLKFAD